MIKEKIANIGRQTLKITLSIASIILLIVFFRWIGFKGLLAFFFGMGLMAYLLLSKNLMLSYIVDYFGAKDHIKEIRKDSSAEQVGGNKNGN